MQDLEPRILRMHHRDRLIAIVLVVALIGTLTIVYFATTRFIGSGVVRTALAVSGVLLALFNAASIAAMLKGNRENRTFIYTLDIKHLDEYRVSRAARRSRARTVP